MFDGKQTPTKQPVVWLICFPVEGCWPIAGKHRTLKQARKAYLKRHGLKRAPAGSYISH